LDRWNVGTVCAKPFQFKIDTIAALPQPESGATRRRIPSANIAGYVERGRVQEIAGIADAARDRVDFDAVNSKPARNGGVGRCAHIVVADVKIQHAVVAVVGEDSIEGGIADVVVVDRDHRVRRVIAQHLDAAADGRAIDVDPLDGAVHRGVAVGLDRDRGRIGAGHLDGRGRARPITDDVEVELAVDRAGVIAAAAEQHDAERIAVLDRGVADHRVDRSGAFRDDENAVAIHGIEQRVAADRDVDVRVAVGAHLHAVLAKTIGPRIRTARF
jgi:hypothetical protein